MTDDELSAVREVMGDSLIRAFRGEVDLATALAEVRDLTPADFDGVFSEEEEDVDEEPEYEEGDLDDDDNSDDEGADADQDEDPDAEELAPEALEAAELDLDAALTAALGR